MSTGDPREPDDAGQHLNRLEAAEGSSGFVQARNVHGGVHFHHADIPFSITPLQLPGDVGGFVNRNTELDALTAIVAEDPQQPVAVAVTVITGTAGVGKTSLALHWAHRIRHHFPDGQLYVNLRGYDPGEPATPGQVLDRFLRDLGVPAAAIPAHLEDRASLYRSLLATRRMLVVLDNAATANQVRPLLPGTASCLVVVTSRSRLSGLMAREGAFRLGLDVLLEQDAIVLVKNVTERYRGHDRPADLVELTRLCARLPLALRIAAERAASRPMMQLDELIADLRDESGLWDALTAEGDEDADAVRTVFAWSYRALPEAAARLFRLLGLHPGNDISLSAAAAIAGTSVSQVRHHLDVLVGAHLLEQHAPGRYQFHDLLRAYSVDQVRHLESPETRTEVLRRVLTWYLHTANAAQARISPFDRYPLSDPVPEGLTLLAFGTYDTALQWYQNERVNLVEATRTAARANLHSIAWRMAAVLRGIYMHQNAFEDWLATGHIGVDSAAHDGDASGEAETLESLGKAYFQCRRLGDAESNHRAALAIRQDLGDRFGEAVSINALGLIDLRRRQLDDAQSRFEESRSIFDQLAEHRWEALLRCNLAETLCERGQPLGASEAVREALPVFQSLKDRFGEGNALFLLSWARRDLGAIAEARTLIDRALAIADDEDNHVWRAHWLVELGKVQRAAGQSADALVSYQHAASIQRRLGDRSREAIAIDGAGLAYAEMGRFTDAARFHHTAASVHREFDDRWNLAQTLANLAVALDREGASDEAQAHRREVLRLLSDFGDSAAASLRARVTEALGAR